MKNLYKITYYLHQPEDDRMPYISYVLADDMTQAHQKIESRFNREFCKVSISTLEILTGFIE